MNKSSKMPSMFDLSGRVAVITGGGGLLGLQHARAVASCGAIPVLLDINGHRAETNVAEIVASFGIEASAHEVDITSPAALSEVKDQILAGYGRIDILINNAANNPKMEQSDETNFSRLENFPLGQWNDDIAVGLTGAFLCSQVFGAEMAKRGSGVIVNVASDLGIIAPDQRIYRQDGLPEHLQPVKPVTYSVLKSGLIGLTRYLATYWALSGVRANCISPGGVENAQPEDFIAKLTNLIPLGRMARIDEYQGAIIFLCSDASSYMTGSNLVIEGGRTCW